MALGAVFMRLVLGDANDAANGLKVFLLFSSNVFLNGDNNMLRKEVSMNILLLDPDDE